MKVPLEKSDKISSEKVRIERVVAVVVVVEMN